MTALQVTATQGGSTAADMGLRVYVLTGAKSVASQTGGSANAQATSGTFTASITTSAGSNVYGGASSNGASGDTQTGSNATVVDATFVGGAEWIVTFKSLNVTSGATTRGYTTASSDAGPLALLEILASGTLAEDASGPVFATAAATTVNTASFSPPGGSLLVAIVASNGGAAQTTMSVTGGGFNWTEKVKNNPSGGDYAGVWIADVPSSAAGEPPWQFDPFAGPAGIGPSRTPWNFFEPYPETLEAPAWGAGNPPPSAGVTAPNGTVPPLIAVYRRVPAQISRGAVGPYSRCSPSAGGVPGTSVPVVPAPAERTPLRFQRIPSRVIFRGLAVSPQQPSLLPRPPPTAVAARPRSQRLRVVWNGKAVLGQQSASATGGLVRRRTTSRAVWNGLAAPPAGRPVTGGLIKRRLSARAVPLWEGIAGPAAGKPTTGGLVKRRSTARAVPVGGGIAAPAAARPIIGGLVKRRVSARAYVLGTVVRTVNAIPGVPGNQPGSGLVKRRAAARAVIQFTPVRTTNAPLLIAGSLQPRSTIRIPRRTSVRATWHGNAIPGQRQAALTGGLVRRRTTSRAIWHGNAGPAAGKPVTGGLIRRRTTARTFWHGNAVTGQIAAPLLGALVKRRIAARAFWGGIAGKPAGLPLTGGLVKRRTAARGYTLGTVVRTTNKPPGVSGNQPGGIVKRRAFARAVTPIQPVAGITTALVPAKVILVIGVPRIRWESEDVSDRWMLGGPFTGG